MSESVREREEERVRVKVKESVCVIEILSQTLPLSSYTSYSTPTSFLALWPVLFCPARRDIREREKIEFLSNQPTLMTKLTARDFSYVAVSRGSLVTCV